MNDHEKVHKYAGPFTHILLGLRTDQHLTRFSWWKGPVWTQSASTDFKLNLIRSIAAKFSYFSENHTGSILVC